jgi:hypothetical protein
MIKTLQNQDQDHDHVQDHAQDQDQNQNQGRKYIFKSFCKLYGKKIRLNSDLGHRKDLELQYNKLEIEYKNLENLRYQQESLHQNIMNKHMQTEYHLKNIELRLSLIHSLGIKLNSNTDFETIVKISKLLGHEISDALLIDLNIIDKKIKNDRANINSIYT